MAEFLTRILEIFSPENLKAPQILLRISTIKIPQLPIYRKHLEFHWIIRKANLPFTVDGFSNSLCQAENLETKFDKHMEFTETINPNQQTRLLRRHLLPHSN